MWQMWWLLGRWEECCRLQLVVVLSYYFLSVAESDNPWPRQCSDECRDCSRELQRPAVTSDNDKLDTQQWYNKHNTMNSVIQPQHVGAVEEEELGLHLGHHHEYSHAALQAQFTSQVSHPSLLLTRSTPVCYICETRSILSSPRWKGTTKTDSYAYFMLTMETKFQLLFNCLSTTKLTF